HLYHLTRSLRQLGYDARILAPSYPGDYLDPDWVHRIGRVILAKGNKSTITLTFDPILPLRVRHFLRAEGFDVVHTHCPIGYNLPYWALHYSMGLNVATFHTAFFGRNLYSYAKLISRLPFKKLDGRIVVSKAALDAIYPHFPDRYRIIGNGIDTTRFSPDSRPDPEIMRFENRILFVGRLDPRKGVEYAIRALPSVIEAIGPVHLFIVGEGNIKTYIRMVDSTYHQYIHYLGYVPVETLPRVYASADVCLFPSVGGESFGIVLLEAMASGVPVVASDISGYNEVITHQRDGYLVPPRDPEAIGKAVVEIFKRPGLRENLIAGGLRKARMFDWLRIASEVLEYYLELI
ncbi:MAG TPA: glycosyltransferase family 1 protein, partial [bacterium (Candidatus Stahlbacteria)]|nr:glycosyltransferase family 1 protein [Candidatus Stahlbacteria bacterium]